MGAAPDLSTSAAGSEDGEAVQYQPADEQHLAGSEPSLWVLLVKQIKTADLHRCGVHVAAVQQRKNNCTNSYD